MYDFWLHTMYMCRTCVILKAFFCFKLFYVYYNEFLWKITYIWMQWPFVRPLSVFCYNELFCCKSTNRQWGSFTWKFTIKIELYAEPIKIMYPYFVWWTKPSERVEIWEDVIGTPTCPMAYELWVGQTTTTELLNFGMSCERGEELWRGYDLL